MRQYNMGYHLREGFHSIFIHGLMSFAAVCMIMACLIIMGSFSLVAINLDHNIKTYEAQNEFTAFVDEMLDEAGVAALKGAIAQVPNVAAVTFETREQALASYAERFAGTDTEQLMVDLPQDTLRHRYRIHVTNLAEMSATAKTVQGLEGVASVSVELATAKGFVMVRNVASSVALVLILMLLVMSLFIIANTIRLATFSRRDEIAVMKMCGATNWFVRWPFIFEGMLLGLVAAALSFFIQWGIYAIIVETVVKFGGLQLLAILPFQNLALQIALIFGGTGIAIGALGSFVAIRKFLQV